ncbi:MAG: CvpA family protein [Balneolales bacterium]|nr:CvpA family protein [Balneolales bacterium]
MYLHVFAGMMRGIELFEASSMQIPCLRTSKPYRYFMNVLDAILLVPLVYFAFQGFRNGLLREVFGFAGVLLALFLGFRYLDSVQDMITGVIPVEDAFIPVLAFVMIFVTVIVLVQLAIIASEAILKFALLSVPNRIFGLLFGLLKSGLFISGMLVLLLAFNLPDEETRQDSLLYPYVISVAPAAYNIVGVVYPGTNSFTETIEEVMKDYAISPPRSDSN